MEYRSHLPQKGIGEWQHVSNVSRRLWLLCFEAIRVQDYPKHNLGKSGSDASLHPGLQVHNSWLGPAYLCTIGGFTKSQLGGVPSDQQSMGRATLLISAASLLTHLVKVEGRIVWI